MLVLDAHCDTASALLDQKADLYENNLHIDLKRLLATGGRVQFFASFSNPVKFRNNDLSRILSIIDTIHLAQEQYADKMSICFNFSDIEEAIIHGRIAAILSVEGGDALNCELSVLRQLYRLGVRSMLLTWNRRNLLADGAHEIHGAGLSDFGRNVVAEMNRLGMILDVSHLCEASFREVLELSAAPVIASHSNAKAVCNHPRNLSDIQLKKLKQKGGVVGITFYPYFLNNTDKADMDDVIKHIEHVCSIIGEDHIGIGSDFDGIDSVTAGLEGTHCLPRLFERLLTLNYSERFIKKLAGRNFMRVIQQVLH